MYFLLAIVVILTKLAQCRTVVQLDQHTLPDGLQSVNGSDPTGGCSRPAAQGRFCVELDEGGTSDLTDCVIPSLGGFQSNWAAGLFTVNRSGQSSFHIGFDFSRPVNFTRVELDLFNCPEWGIAAQTITVYENTFGIYDFIAALARALGHTTANTISCTSIVRVVIPLEFPQNPTDIYVIDFTFDNTTTNIQWVHFAEVRFLEEYTQCPTPSSTAGHIPTQPTCETVRPALSQETVQHTLSQETVQPTLSQETVLPTLPQETVLPTLSQETVQPTLSQENVQHTLPQVTAQHTPGNIPLPDGSPVTLVTAVITTIVILLVIALGVVVLAVILIRARRKTEIKDLQTTMMEDEKVEYEEVQLNTLIEMKENDAYQQPTMKASIRVSPHTDNAAVYDNVTVYEEVRGGGRNQGVGFVMEENEAYGWHLQRGEAATVSPSDEVEYEEI